ncbi:hypothetical protein TNCV_789501 [Trichonephila clavipes]|nr:hypothetical protein TNCV_789501 [Trichonephila clavipes]
MTLLIIESRRSSFLLSHHQSKSDASPDSSDEIESGSAKRIQMNHHGGYGSATRKQINLEVDSDDVQEVLDSHNQELTMDELIEMHEQHIEELESLDPVKSED